jgi:hypothetical protein
LSKTFYKDKKKKNRQNPIFVPPRFVLSRFGEFLKRGFQKHHTNICTKKKHVEIVLQKKSTEIQIQCRFLLDLFLALAGYRSPGNREIAVWAFFGEGTPKSPQQIFEIVFRLVTSLASDPPAHRGGVRLFLGGPLAGR